MTVKSPNGPKVLLKIEVLMMDLLKTLRNYPKTEKYTLGERTELKLLDGAEAIFYASFVVQSRKQRLLDARVHFQMVVFLLRIARRQGFISENYYEKISMDFAEIGKMISGWINTIIAQEEARAKAVKKGV